MFVRFNKHGGVLAESDQELKRAKDVDLITLPEKVKGTNCFNCKFIKNKMIKQGDCVNPRVKQKVNERQCCVLWQATGEYRQFKGRSDKYKE